MKIELNKERKQKMISYVRSLTKKNMHTEARIYVAAKIVNDEDLTKKYEAIRETQNKQGYITPQQYEERYKIDKTLKIKLIQKNLVEYYMAL